MWTKIKNGTNKAAEKITGKKGKPSRNDSFDEECQTALEGKNKDYKKMINRNTRQNENEYKNKRREVK
jgi:hypothetical protein